MEENYYVEDNRVITVKADNTTTIDRFDTAKQAQMYYYMCLLSKRDTHI